MSKCKTSRLAGVVLAGGVALAAGCAHGDPCWPDRYANEARAAVVANFQPQVENGQVLDQTLWNQHFAYGTDRLNGAGMDKLDQVARRRPQPDPRLFLQTARDIPFDPARPDEYAARRAELDTRRTAAVQKYLAATLTGRPAPFDIQIHDPAYPGIDGAAPRVIIPPPAARVGTAVIPGAGVPGAVPGAVPVGAAVPAAAPPAPASSVGWGSGM